MFKLGVGTSVGIEENLHNRCMKLINSHYFIDKHNFSRNAIREFIIDFKSKILQKEDSNDNVFILISKDKNGLNPKFKTVKKLMI